MKNLWPLLIAVVICVCLGCTANGATVRQTDQALAAVELSVQNSKNILQQGNTPTRPLPSDVAAKELGPIHMISEPGVPPTTFDASYLSIWLNNAEKINDTTRAIAIYTSVIQMIEQMRSQVQTLKHSSPNTSVQVRSMVRAELADNVYGYDPPPEPTIADKFGTWLSKAIADLFAKLTPKYHPRGNFNFPPGFFTALALIVKILIVVVIGAIVVFLLVVLIRWIMNRRNGYRPLASDDAAEAALLEARDTDSILARANQLAETGDYRKAFRLVYLAALVALDTDGILHFDRSRTNWEYLRELRRGGRRDLYDQLVPFTREFDRIWYGFGSVDASVYATAVIRYKDLKASTKIIAAVPEVPARQ